MDHTCRRSSQGELTLDLWCRQTFSDLAIRVCLGPHEAQIRDWRVSDPVFGTMQHVVVTLVDRSGNHTTWVGTNIGLRQAEATHDLSRCKPGQKSLLLFLRSKHVDWMHH